VNGENRASCSSFMPMPVSRTLKRSISGELLALTSTDTAPRSVNLIALPARLTSTCCSAARRPPACAAPPAPPSCATPVLFAALTLDAGHRLHHLVRAEAHRMQLHLPGLHLGEIEDVVQDAQQRLA
jgi:hypothetical protein